MKFHIIVVLVIATVLTQAQDITNTQGFDFKKLKPIVQVFGTATYNINKSHFGYYIGRAHLGLEYSFNDKWSSKIIIDRGRPTTFNDLIITDSSGYQYNVDWTYSEGAYYTMYLKFATLRWEVNKKLIIEGGAILQNHYITQERFWALRYVAQTFQDLYWRIPSTDLGLIVYYIINKHFSCDIALTNGEGPRINQDDIGNIKVAGGININPFKRLKTRIYYHYRKASINGGSSSEQMFSFFTGWKPFPKTRMGGEFNYMDSFQGVRNMNSYGYSIYGAQGIFPKAEIFARFDRLIFTLPKDLITSTLDNGSTFIGGLSFTPVKGVLLSINYQGWFPDKGELDNESRITLGMEYKF